jgi:LysM repeat protein
MGITPLRRLAFLWFAVLSIGLMGCTRTASTPPATSSSLSQEDLDQRATMDAVEAEIQTQAAGPNTLLPTATFTPNLPTSTATLAAPTPTPGEIADTPTPISQDQTYIVQPGEWVYSIARKFGVDPESLIEANDLLPPFNLEVGQELIIPATGSVSAPANTPNAGENTYTVAAGDSVYSIATAFGVEAQAVIDANDLVYPYTLYPGDVLIIP